MYWSIRPEPVCILYILKVYYCFMFSSKSMTIKFVSRRFKETLTLTSETRNSGREISLLTGRSLKHNQAYMGDPLVDRQMGGVGGREEEGKEARKERAEEQTHLSYM